MVPPCAGGVLFNTHTGHIHAKPTVAQQLSQATHNSNVSHCAHQPLQFTIVVTLTTCGCSLSTVGLMDLALTQLKGGIELAFEGRKEVTFQQDDVNLRKRTRADCGELLRRVRVKGTHRLCKAAPRRFPLQIDTRAKWCTFFATAVRKKKRTLQLRDYHLRTVSHKFGRGASVIASATSGPHSQANAVTRQTLELQSHLSSCTCPLRRERETRTANGSNILKKKQGNMIQHIDKKNKWTRINF